MNTDITTLRELVKAYVAVCNDPAQSPRRDLCRRHNSLKPTRPLIYVRACGNALGSYMDNRH
jgi:hypothetical protein